VGQNNNPTSKPLLNKPTYLGCQVIRPGQQAAPLSCKMHGRSILIEDYERKNRYRTGPGYCSLPLEGSRLLICCLSVVCRGIQRFEQMSESGHCNEHMEPFAHTICLHVLLPLSICVDPRCLGQNVYRYISSLPSPPAKHMNTISYSDNRNRKTRRFSNLEAQPSVNTTMRDIEWPITIDWSMILYILREI